MKHNHGAKTALTVYDELLVLENPSVYLHEPKLFVVSYSTNQGFFNPRCACVMASGGQEGHFSRFIARYVTNEPMALIRGAPRHQNGPRPLPFQQEMVNGHTSSFNWLHSFCNWLAPSCT